MLLGLMAKYSCEDCKLLLYFQDKFVLFEIENQGTILTNLVKAMERVKVGNLSYLGVLFFLSSFKMNSFS